MRHCDFQRIYDEFCSYYRDTPKGESEYYSWVNALGVDESKPYGSARESFKWAKSMLNFLKEDANSKYYGVIVGLPWRSMNGNVYKERDLIAAALSLKGKHPSLNHKDEFWFNEQNRYGTITVEDAKYEEGAIEAVLKVPKTTVCPICNGAPMTKLIDEQHIVNVSLEGNMNGAFEFTDPPFTLLTTDVLPGIPLARIKPLEQIVSEALKRTNITEGKKMKVEAKIIEGLDIGNSNSSVNTKSLTDPDFKGNLATPVNADMKIDTQNDLAKTAVGTPAATDNYNMHVDGNKLSSISHEAAMECPLGTKLNPESGKCEPCATEAVTNDTSQPKPEDIRLGPSRNKVPERGIPSNGGLPSSVTPNTVSGTSPVDRSVWTGSSPVESLPSLEERRARVHAEMQAKNSEEKAIAWEQKHNEIYEKLVGLTAQYKELARLHESFKADAKNERDQNNQKLENTIIRMEKATSDYNAVAGDKLKLEHRFADLTEQLNSVSKKYSESMQTNLSLSQKLTVANEDYLDVAKKLDNTAEALERSRIEAKKIVKIRV